MKTFLKVALVALAPLAGGAAPNSVPPASTAEDVPVFELGAVTILVRDEDQAANWYHRNLGLKVALDTHASDGERFVALKPARGSSPLIVLHRPRTSDIEPDRKLAFSRIGQETYWVWRTADFDAAYKRLQDNHVEFVSTRRTPFYGREAVFKDLYGNLFILQQLGPDYHGPS